MNFRPEPDQLAKGGMILINKPYTWTSFDAIHYLKKYLKLKMGHAGTLDPLATGLLICCTGPWTRRLTEFQKLEKEYTGTIFLGARTPTFDLESEPEPAGDIGSLVPEDLESVRQQYLGIIQQVPPAHSAIKKEGKRAYALARAGKEIKMEPREVEIKEFEFTRVELPEVDFRVQCSTGTYIRSLAHDLGNSLGVGGYLKSLIRTRIGEYSLDQALTPKEWREYWSQKELS